MQAPSAQLQTGQVPAIGNQIVANGKKPKVIGVYGLPGTGKTTLLRWLQEELDESEFAFYDGSEVISMIVPGGLDAFKKSSEEMKIHYRSEAIETIARECAESQKVGVVAGRCMLSESEGAKEWVMTDADWATYTHILYLDVPAEIIAIRCREDVQRVRPVLSLDHLREWQQAEKAILSVCCGEHDILLMNLSSSQRLGDRALELVRDFRRHDEASNLRYATDELDELVSRNGQLETMLVIDADKTLAPQDTGAVFWDGFGSKAENPFVAVFSGPLGYKYTGFRQAMLLYEFLADLHNEAVFDTMCEWVVPRVILHAEFVSLLKRVAAHKHVGAVIVTCGLRRIWEKVLKAAGLSTTVNLIGGGRISDGFVVTAAVKGALVSRLRHHHHMNVWAFGDSPLDLEMLRNANQAVVVVGEEKDRSKSMDEKLFHALYHDGLHAYQLLLPSSAPPRLNTVRLPLMQLKNAEVNLICLRRKTDLRLVHATDRVANRLLTTPTRDFTVAGPDLRKAHSRVGYYLATEFMPEVIGLEEYKIPHVQNRQTIGYRLRQEDKTLIVALMRGGEPMALGVSYAFPHAIFKHANDPEDLTEEHVSGLSTIVLVDSVINEGTTIRRFVKHIRAHDAKLPIVVVANVVQVKSVSRAGALQSLASDFGNLSLIALCLSENQYTGKGTTDTGNRLFNTTHLEK